MGRRQGGLGPQSRALRCAGESFEGGADVYSSSFLINSFDVGQGKAMVGTEQLHSMHCCFVSKVETAAEGNPKEERIVLNNTDNTRRVPGQGVCTA